MEIFSATAKVNLNSNNEGKIINNEVQNHEVSKIKESNNIDKNKNKESNFKSVSLMNEEEKNQYIKDLNDSLSPLSKYIKFGWDSSSEILYISVIDTKTNEVIRRFPEEEAETIMKKVQDIKGFLYTIKVKFT